MIPGESTIKWRKGFPSRTRNYLGFWPSSRVAQAQFWLDGSGFGIWYGPGGSEPPLYWGVIHVPAGWARTGLEVEA